MKLVLIEGDIARVELTQGQETIIDVDDVHRVRRYTWHAIPNTMGGYYARSGSVGYLHRYLLDAPKGMTVDHINHDTLDNRRANIRLCTNRQNNENRNGAYSNSLLKIRNISTHRDGNRVHYMVRVSPNGKQIVRYFPYTPEGLEQAKIAAVEMRQQYFTHSTKETASVYVVEES